MSCSDCTVRVTEVLLGSSGIFIRMTLKAELRLPGASEINGVRHACMHSDGEISVIEPK
jgi:uncharacterized membrane protein YcaP (DUF421 family)